MKTFGMKIPKNYLVVIKVFCYNSIITVGMNTNIKNKWQEVKTENREPRLRVLCSNSGNSFTNFFDAMNDVNLNSPVSKLNETSIDDNRGGRIELNQDQVIKK